MNGERDMEDDEEVWGFPRVMYSTLQKSPKMFDIHIFFCFLYLCGSIKVQSGTLLSFHLMIS